MSRYHPDRNTAPIFAAAREWCEQCLLADGSVLFPGQSIWTAANIDQIREAFNSNPDEGPDSFLIKLHRQFSGRADAVFQLVAELIWVILLFPSNTTAQKKRETVLEILSWSSAPSAPDMR